MPLPNGITTCAVTFGADFDYSGATVGADMVVRPTADAVWAATGQRLVSFAFTASSTGGVPATVNLPHTDQSGFTDGSGAGYTGWAYVLAVTYKADSGAYETITKPFQPLVGQTTIDFDNIPGGSISQPVTAPQAAVTSLNGQTGALSGFAKTTDLNSYMPFWQPNTAYTSGQRVVNPSGQTVTANSSFTSGSSYNASNWTVVAGGGSSNALGSSSNPVTDPAAARPAGLTVVYWRTSTAPTNMASGDEWTVYP